MAKGPKGGKRPADVTGSAVGAMEIAAGQRDEEDDAADGGKDMAWAAFIACRDHAGPQTVRRALCELQAQDRPRRPALASGEARR